MRRAEFLAFWVNSARNAGREVASMREVRKLYSPVHGAVSSLCELNTGGERHRGEGFAVSARSFPARLYYRLIPAAEVLSPADGAVTAAENDAFRLRTGDGLELEVLLPLRRGVFRSDRGHGTRRRAGLPHFQRGTPPGKSGGKGAVHRQLPHDGAACPRRAKTRRSPRR